MLTRRAVAQGAWDGHLAMLKKAVKCRAGLFGLDAVQWAGHAELHPSVDEVRYLIGGFATKTTLFASGPKLEGTKFMTVRADGTTVVLKHGTDGVVCIKSKKAVTLCAFNEATTTSPQALAATQKFAELLASIGY